LFARSFKLNDTLQNQGYSKFRHFYFLDLRIFKINSFKSNLTLHILKIFLLNQANEAFCVERNIKNHNLNGFMLLFINKNTILLKKGQIS